jgi:hypothetical protein
MISKLWSSRIGSILTVIHLQLNDSLRFTVQEMQRKGLGMPDVIGDARSKWKVFASNSEFFYLHYFSTVVSELWVLIFICNWYLSPDYDFWLFSCNLWSQFLDCLKEFVKILSGVQNRQIFWTVWYYNVIFISLCYLNNLMFFITVVELSVFSESEWTRRLDK